MAHPLIHKQNLSRDVQRISTGWHAKAWTLESISASEYGDAITMCFHDERYCRLRNERCNVYNSIVETLKSGNATVSRINSQFRKLKETDDAMGAILLEHMATYSLSKNGKKVIISEDDFKKDDFTEKQQTAYDKIGVLFRQLAFKFDSIETDLLEMESAVNIIDEHSTFSAADGIRTAISQLRSFINNSNEKLTTQEEKDLYADTADRISEYLNERVRVYNNKLARLKNRLSKRDKQ